MSPSVRENRLAQLIGALPEGRRILVSHGGDDLQEIDLKRFPHVRRATAISIRQAYYAPANVRLEIELTKSRYAWASLLLAVRRAGTSKLRIDPSVARDANEFLLVVRRSIPSALSSELHALTDPEADFARMLKRSSMPISSHPLDPEIEIEQFPESSGVAGASAAPSHAPVEISRTNPALAEPIKAQIPRESLHEQIWEALASTWGGPEVSISWSDGPPPKIGTKHSTA